jgi:hypothetical protein
MASPSKPAQQSAQDVVGLIRAAILEKHLLRAIYEGRERWLCPQMLGRNKEGRLRVLCLPVSGESVSGLRLQGGQGDWRCLSLEKFSGVERVAGVWQTGGAPPAPAQVH